MIAPPLFLRVPPPNLPHSLLSVIIVFFLEDRVVPPPPASTLSFLFVFVFSFSFDVLCGRESPHHDSLPAPMFPCFVGRVSLKAGSANPRVADFTSLHSELGPQSAGLPSRVFPETFFLRPCTTFFNISHQILPRLRRLPRKRSRCLCFSPNLNFF